MVMGFRERRLGCRLYVDRQSDANILKKTGQDACGWKLFKSDGAYQERYRAGL